MRKSDLRFGGISIQTQPGWADITDELEGNDKRFTMAKREQGIGALQFSIAFCKSGVNPEMTVKDLISFLQDLVEIKQLRNPHAQSSTDGENKIAAASFGFQEDFVRVWYCSDGRNIAPVTYTSDTTSSTNELSECEEIVKSIRFDAHGEKSYGRA